MPSSIIAQVEGSGVGSGGLTKLIPTAWPTSLIPAAELPMKRGNPPKPMILPSLHYAAVPFPLIRLCPATCPVSLMDKAMLDELFGSKLMTLPSLHSVA